MKDGMNYRDGSPVERSTERPYEAGRFLEIANRKPGDYLIADAEDAMTPETRKAWFAHFQAMTHEQKAAFSQRTTAERVAEMERFAASMSLTPAKAA